MLRVRDVISELRRVDGEAFITMIVPYATAPIYVEQISTEKDTVTISGTTRYENTIEDMVLHFGEKHRKLIESALPFMIKLEEDLNLEKSNYLEYLRGLISRVHYPAVDNPQEYDRSLDDDEDDWGDGDFEPFGGLDEFFGDDVKRMPTLRSGKKI